MVTRPQPEADHWVTLLQREGIASCALPLMVIGPNTNPTAQAAIAQAVAQLHRYHALMFVSGNAVRYFWQHLPSASTLLSPSTRCWSPGPGTTQALLAAGIAASRIDQPSEQAPQFDSEALWAQVHPQALAGRRVLVVRGGDGASATGQGRTWLTEQLLHRGVQVDFAPVYTRQAPTITGQWLAMAHTLREQQAIWLFSSSECVQHLQSSQPTWDWSSHTALATHPRIAAQAQSLGFGHVVQTHPSVHSIAGSIKSLA